MGNYERTAGSGRFVTQTELEKALGGMGGSNDSGVGSRLLGSLLTWLSDHTSDVFVVMTANDISALPPELTRSGRLDGVFFVGMPTQEQREAIWKIHLAKCNLPLDAERPPAEMWTGADIAQCCRLSVLMQESLLDAARRVVPNFVRYRDRLESVCKWAHQTTLDAETGFPYIYDDYTTKANAGLFDASREALAAQPSRSRKITRKTVGSNNG